MMHGHTNIMNKRYLPVKKIFSECSWRPVCVCVCEGRLIPPPQDCATLIDRGMCSSHPDSMTNDTHQADRTPTTTARLKENRGVEKTPIATLL